MFNLLFTFSIAESELNLLLRVVTFVGKHECEVVVCVCVWGGGVFFLTSKAICRLATVAVFPKIRLLKRAAEKRLFVQLSSLDV